MVGACRSTAAVIAKPAFSKPRSSPPAPQNKLTSSLALLSLPSARAGMFPLTVVVPHFLEELGDREPPPCRFNLNFGLQRGRYPDPKQFGALFRVRRILLPGHRNPRVDESTS